MKRLPEQQHEHAGQFVKGFQGIGYPVFVYVRVEHLGIGTKLKLL